MKSLLCNNNKDDGEDGEAKKLSRKIDKELEKERDSYNKTYRLLVLGPGESGKSTFIKQMKILHHNGYNETERKSYIAPIRDNVISAMKAITGAMMTFSPPIELADSDNQPSFDWIQSTSINADDDDCSETAKHIAALWKDEGVQACFKRSNEFLLYDSAQYFLDEVESIFKSDFLPNDQDILRCRKITTGIFETKFFHKGVNFHFFDVGGQRKERRKWIQCFSDATVVLYVASCSCYDMMLREDDTQNQLTESVELLAELWNNRFLRYLSHILFLNKEDQLMQKVRNNSTTNLLQHFPEFAEFEPSRTKLSEYDTVKEFILEKFMSSVAVDEDDNDAVSKKNSSANRHIYPHFTTAVDTENIRRVFSDTRDLIRRIVLDEMSGQKTAFNSERWIDRNMARKSGAIPLT